MTVIPAVLTVYVRSFWFPLCVYNSSIIAFGATIGILPRDTSIRTYTYHPVTLRGITNFVCVIIITCNGNPGYTIFHTSLKQAAPPALTYLLTLPLIPASERHADDFWIIVETPLYSVSYRYSFIILLFSGGTPLATFNTQ